MNASLDRVKNLVTVEPVPNAYGGTFMQVRVKGQPVGVYKVVDGGFLPLGARKPRKTEREAQSVVIHSRIRALLRETVPLMEALNEVS